MKKPEWNINELVKAANLKCEIVGENVKVSGLQIDNREVENNDVYFCIVGLSADGHRFAKSAVEKGASVLFVQHKLELDVCQVIVDNTRDAMAQIADAFYWHPSNKLKIVGVTGTNGKTTITNVVSHVICQNGDTCACIGTTGIKINGESADPSLFKYLGRTTPESFQLQKMFYELVEMGIHNVVMEVSSHALVQNRVAGINFDVVAFTNLTQDHLDYHKTIENYFEAKAILFGDKYPAKRVICIDDKWGQALYDKCMTNGDDILTCGFSQGDITQANTKVNFPLLGKFNIQNMLISFAICKFLGIADDKIKSALSTTPSVEGRMQVVKSNNNVRAVVDYAHTPDALEKAILSLKEICEGRLITIFGCGGDRDKDKRPKMGYIAAKNSDFCIVTSDNPRSEDPQDIINDILSSMKDFDNYKTELDREEAIKAGIFMAKEKDIVLIAGKGHEKTQDIGGKIIHFDDVEIAKKYLK